MNGDQDDDDAVLLRKIQVLLDAPHSDEFLLVALVLLTRVASAEKLQQIWTTYGNVTLNSYCCRLQEKQDYLHIVARLVNRLERGTAGDEVFQVLWNVLAERVESKAPLTTFDVDLVLALNASVPDKDTNALLDTVWQRFRQVQGMPVGKEQPLNDNDVTVDSSPSSVDEKLVQDTLHALLKSESDLQTSLTEAVLTTFLTHGPQACRDTDSVPSWYQPMVLYVTSESTNSLPPRLKAQLQGLVLQCTLGLTLHCPPEFRQVLSYSKSLSTALVNLILVYITSSPCSSSEQEIDLQSLAWTTLAAMVQAFGFDWIILSSGTSPSLGTATSLCTLLRLATGEWRIQLGRLCVEEEEEQDGFIVDNCGQIICAGLDHVMRLMDESKNKFEMQASALLHFRDSLQDALHATVQYLCQSSSSQQQAQVIAGRVLGGLLTEFNVWDGLPNGISSDETLEALSVALHASSTSDADHNALMPCLVMVLASVEDQDYCIKLLDKHHLLGKTLIYFLMSYWNNLGDDDTSQCSTACQVAELWYTMTNPPSSVTAPLRKAIMQWIRKQVEHGPSPQVMSALPSVVDCYVMLFGQDAVPSERDATIVQRALEICEARQSS